MEQGSVAGRDIEPVGQVAGKLLAFAAGMGLVVAEIAVVQEFALERVVEEPV